MPTLAADASGRTLLVTGGLAFVAGFVDVVGFVALFGLFTAHVTGNFVVIGAAIAQGSEGVIAKLLSLPVFVLVVALTHIAISRLQAAGRDVLVPSLAAEALLLLAFMATGMTTGTVTNPDAGWPIAVGLVGVAAMAVQNAAGRLVLGNQAPTTIMTGNTTQIVIDLVDAFAASEKPRTDARIRLRRMVPPMLAFTFGALTGAIGYAGYGFAVLIAPIAVIAVVIAACRRRIASAP